MKCQWIGIAMLAGSWLFGLSYYHEADAVGWSVCVLAGLALLSGAPVRLPGAPQAWGALVVLLPVVWLSPWPHRMIPMALVAGIALRLLPYLPRWMRGLGSGALAAGAVLLAQAMVMFAYERLTARSHELPWGFPRLIAGLASLLGMDAAAANGTVSIGSMRKVFPFGATWGLFIDPVTLCFAVGGIILLAAHAWRCDHAGRLGLWLRSCGVLLLAVVLWLPLRLTFMLGLYLNRVLLTDYDEKLNVMDQFLSGTLHLLTLAGPVLLLWRWIPALDWSAEPETAPAPDSRRCAIAWTLAAFAGALVVAGLFWDPVGQRKPGRLIVDEGHGAVKDGRYVTWEPTGRPMDTSWYGHDSGYNYACAYDYLSRFYDTHRLTTPITDAVLARCDVLMLKTPTSRFTSEEIGAIRKFVENGGGLFLVGEHTDVFGTGTYLNEIASRYGFLFRYDCLFGIDSVFEQHYVPGRMAHPIVQHMPPMDFAVSCSIDPGWSDGRAAIVGTGLKNAMADYHASNFYPQVEDRADARFGAFVQVWSVRSGKGRIVAHSDSTIWSNFSTFEPGKMELLMGCIEWLNHRNTLPDPRWPLIALGMAALAATCYWARGVGGAWLMPTALALLGWTVCGQLVQTAQRRAMPPPRAQRPFVQVIMDQTASSVVLPKNGFIMGKADGYGIFERWILRLGYFIARRSGPQALDGNLVVFLLPDKPVTAEYRKRMIRYVADGGHILVIDSADNKKSLANSLLRPFGMWVDSSAPESGSLVAAGWPTVSVNGACQVKFAETETEEVGHRTNFASVNGRTVGATVKFGRGSVTAIGFGNRFCDLNMGVTGDVVPDQKLRQVFECQFRLLRQIIEGPAATRPATTQPLSVEGDGT